MQNRGNFVLNKAHCLMNIDGAGLCVYPKSARALEEMREREERKRGEGWGNLGKFSPYSLDWIKATKVESI